MTGNDIEIRHLCATHRGPHAPLADPGSHVCTGCHDQLTTAVNDLALVTLIDLWLTTTRIGERPGTTESQPPARVDIIDVKTAATTAAFAAAARIATDLHLTIPRTIPNALTLIRRHLDHATSQPWIADHGRRIITAAHQLTDLVDGDPHARPVATCQVWRNGHECGGPLRPTPSGAVVCSHCDDTWTADELHRLGLTHGAHDMPLRTKMQRLGRMTSIIRETQRLPRRFLDRMQADHDTAWAGHRNEWTAIWDAARTLAWEADRADEWHRFQTIDFAPVYDACVVVAAGDLIDDRTDWTAHTRDQFAAPFTGHCLLELLD